MRFRDMAVNIFTSGKSLSYTQYKKEKIQEHGVSDYLLKYILLNFIHIFGFIVNVLFVFKNLANKAYFDVIACSFLALVLIIDIFISRAIVPQIVPAVISTISFGLFCIMVIWKGDAQGAGFIFIFLYPILTVILTGMVKGTVFSAILLVIVIIESLVPSASQFEYHLDVSLRMIAVYILLLGSILVFETSRQNKDKINHNLLNELAQERDIIQTMKDNINQGIFLMDRELRILPNYSKPLAAILSYYDSELAGKSFLDILSASLDIRQLQTMKDYFEMIFSKTHNVEVLESANPISEFEYRTDGRIKILTTKFELIEEADCESLIIGIIQDITREKEFAKELQAQKEAQELEMVNMFDVIQVDPLVFRDFIEDTESNFNQINSVLKDSSMTEKQALTKFFQNVHAIKSNALILGLRTFGRKLHALEDEIKAVSDNDKIIVEDILGLVIKLEEIMQEKDSYTRIIKKIEAFKVSNQIDTVLIHSMTKAAEKISMETQKKVELKTGQIDIGILETKLRKPIKDILFQCIRNSIYHGIEPIDERIQKNKKPQGLLAFSIKNVNGNAEVTFSDDGRGLDWNKIKARYLSMYPDARKPGKKVLLEAIFSPEFSTTESASTIAGRGVGLSLVKDLVKENNGSIKVDSSNSGLTLKFTFPPVS